MDSRIALLIAVGRINEDIRAAADARAVKSIDAPGRRPLTIRRFGRKAPAAAIVRR